MWLLGVIPKETRLDENRQNVFLSLCYLYSYTGCDNAVVHDVCVFFSACVRETSLLLLPIALTHLLVGVWCSLGFGWGFRIRICMGLQKLGIYILCSLH